MIVKENRTKPVKSSKMAFFGEGKRDFVYKQRCGQLCAFEWSCRRSTGWLLGSFTVSVARPSKMALVGPEHSSSKRYLPPFDKRPSLARESCNPDSLLENSVWALRPETGNKIPSDTNHYKKENLKYVFIKNYDELHV